MTRTIRALFPGEEHALAGAGAPGFAYFADAAARPFDPQQAVPNWAHAWWAAQLALLAYSHEKARVADCLSLGGLWARDYAGATARHLTAHDGHGNVWVAFRGTEIVAPSDWSAGWPSLSGKVVAALANWTNNLAAAPEPFLRALGGWPAVHSGFAEAYLRAKAALRRDLVALAPRSLWFTGHSRGGAIALLAAADPEWKGVVRGLYTFGAPPAVNTAWAHRVSVPHGRVLQGLDAIQLAPLGWLSYVHHGALAKRPLASMEKMFASIGVRDDPGSAISADGLPVALKSFAHHAPLLYVAQCAANLGRPWG